MRRNGKAVRQSMHEGVLGSMGVISVLAMTVRYELFVPNTSFANPAIIYETVLGLRRPPDPFRRCR